MRFDEPQQHESKAATASGRDVDERTGSSSAASPAHTSEAPVTAPPLVRRSPPSPRNKARRLVVVLSVVLALALVAGGLALFSTLAQRQPAPGPTPTPVSSTFQSASCPFKPAGGVVEGRDVRCGSLAVPEDRTRPQSPTIQLAVAIFKTPSPHPASNPVIELAGGPGAGLLQDVGPVLDAKVLSSWPANRDLILLDQRGTGYSRPALACPELNAYQDAILEKPLSREGKTALFVQAMRTCHDRLVKEGIDLNAYNTLEDAADVHALVRALGYRQVNLQTGSYSSRLALTIMRLFPSDIRSVVLDSADIPQTNVFLYTPSAAQRAFDTLFRGCAVNGLCNQRYPELRRVFAQLVTDLNTSPVTLQVKLPQAGQARSVLFSGDDLVQGVRAALYQTSLLPILPAVIYQLHRHDYTLLSQLYSALAQSDTINWGMYYSVECGEMMAFTTLPELRAAVQVVEPESRPYFLARAERDYQVCQLWHVQPVPAVQKAPVTSAIPALILAGEYDPAVPPDNGQLAAQTLSRGYYFLFPGTGHGVQFTSSCANAIALAFQDRPTVKPDASCISGLGEPDFV